MLSCCMDNQQISESRGDATLFQDTFSLMEELRQAKTLCDFTITVGTETFAAHRIVLASGIPYFRSMFSQIESPIEGTTLEGVAPSAVESLIKFSYNKKLNITKNNVEDLLKASLLLKMDVITETCLQFLIKQLNSETAFKILELADQCQCTRAIEMINDFIQENFEQVCMSKEFLRLPFSAIKELIAKDGLFVMKEDTVAEAVLRWVSEDEIKRSVYIEDLFQDVRFPFLSAEYFVSSNMLHYNILRPDVASPCSERYCERKQHLKYGKMMESALYSVCIGYSTFAINYYDFIHEKWVNLCRLGILDDIGYESYIICMEEQILFIKTGVIVTFCLKKLNVISTIRDCHFPHIAKFVVLNNTIYLLGTSDIGNDIVIYAVCCQQGTCSEVGRLSLNRRFFSVVSLGEYIYVIGGCTTVPGYNEDDIVALSTAEKHNPTTAQCSAISPMLHRRSSHVSATLCDKIYVCGGYLGESKERTTSAEQYDPMTDEWNVIAPLNDIKNDMSLVSCAGRLYAADRCIKAFWNTEDPLPIKIYDPSENKWQSAESITRTDDQETVVLVSTNTTSRFLG